MSEKPLGRYLGDKPARGYDRRMRPVKPEIPPNPEQYITPSDRGEHVQYGFEEIDWDEVFHAPDSQPVVSPLKPRRKTFIPGRDDAPGFNREDWVKN